MLGALAKTYYPEKTGMPADQIYQFSIMPCTAKKYELERTRKRSPPAALMSIWCSPPENLPA
ncbi:MAG: hypothetical protein JJT75_09340 [Opitutales bacterium]|nr:hypothetical protein [Opitutales bacterium]